MPPIADNSIPWQPRLKPTIDQSINNGGNRSGMAEKLKEKRAF